MVYSEYIQIMNEVKITDAKLMDILKSNGMSPQFSKDTLVECMESSDDTEETALQTSGIMNAKSLDSMVRLQ